MGVYPIVIAACLFLSAGTVGGPPAAAAKKESPYEIATRLRREAAKKAPERAFVGPTVARLEPEPARQAGKSPEVAAGERILHFPMDRSLGKLMIRPARAGGTADTLQWWLYVAPWEFIGQAQGDVTIPAGHEVSLSVWHQEGWRDLAPLLKLRPDDLYQLGSHARKRGEHRGTTMRNATEREPLN